MLLYSTTTVVTKVTWLTFENLHTPVIRINAKDELLPTFQVLIKPTTVQFLRVSDKHSVRTSRTFSNDSLGGGEAKFKFKQGPHFPDLFMRYNCLFQLGSSWPGLGSGRAAGFQVLKKIMIRARHPCGHVQFVRFRAVFPRPFVFWLSLELRWAG